MNGSVHPVSEPPIVAVRDHLGKPVAFVGSEEAFSEVAENAMHQAIAAAFGVPLELIGPGPHLAEALRKQEAKRQARAIVQEGLIEHLVWITLGRRAWPFDDAPASRVVGRRILNELITAGVIEITTSDVTVPLVAPSWFCDAQRYLERLAYEEQEAMRRRSIRMFLAAERVGWAVLRPDAIMKIGHC